MSYQVLARKYRPQSFDEVIGQDASVQTLKNAITLKRIHQAYLFCGARGVGKTSMARIFAKSLNCEKGPTPTPCQTCGSCTGITKSSSMEVLEIDGASNTSVDDVRELREQAKYLPGTGKYKIYIIDEVHMLSTSAFNALLKILEEPPPHIIFIFATTEPHKIPVTILSRTQRYDFKSLPINGLLSHLQNILKKESLSMNQEALALIAHSAQGSVRDALSLLDQIINFSGTEVSAQKVREVLGLTDRILLFETLKAVLDGNPGQVIHQAQNICNKGGDLKIFCEELLELIRHLMVLKEGGAQFVDLVPGEKERLTSFMTGTNTIQLINLFQILARGAEEIARSEFPQLVFEITLIKMVKLKELVSVAELIQGVQGKTNPIEENTSSPFVPQGLPLVVRGTTGGRGELSPPTNPGPRIQDPAPPSWTIFVQHVCQTKPQLGSILEHARFLSSQDNKINKWNLNSELRSREGEAPAALSHREHFVPMEGATQAPIILILAFEKGSIYKDMLQERLNLAEDLATSFFKKPVKIQTRILESSITIPSAYEVRKEKETLQSQKIKEEALSSQSVKMVEQILGAKVKEVRELK